ncbi:hypothetical protein FOCG_16412 [Fusarium oxysporum f. sp. radicis-lycopersici 26381]|nr:hypothetical protein FOWG_05557 [Fusarium oxysporum f. sp. lycopersici MN25]EXL41026.1 hypothetical protein FOCG_16412 [Fusarium oxysporum f. sp. radicis-lycopersici 26381]
MTAGAAGTKGTAGTAGSALILLLLFTSQTSRTAETIPATAAGIPTPSAIVFSDDIPPDFPSEVSVGDGASSVDVLVDVVAGPVDEELLSVEIVSDAVKIGCSNMITSAVGWTSVHHTSEAGISENFHVWQYGIPESELNTVSYDI